MSLDVGDMDSSGNRGGGATAYRPPSAGRVTFDRFELRRILGLYRRKVASGEWRDYAIDFHRDRAVFSVFRSSAEAPLYRIEKNPRFGRRQGVYRIVSATGLIVNGGHELDRVLRSLDKAALSVVAC